MKLLGWMHRKLMQNSTEPLKNDSTDQRSTNAFEPANEPFDFLSIGTFGTDLLLHTAPPTPTLLPTPVEPLTGQPIDINENDLDLISQELEKFLESEDAETVHNSSERSSKASVITINDQGNLQICPLQKYLLAAPVELAEMGREEVKKTRTSLEELFKEGNDGPLLKKGEGVGGKGNVARLVKKFVKRLSHKSSDGTAGFNDDDDYDGAVFRPTKKKLTKKLVKMFNKKVYPEEMAEKQILKVTKSNEKKNYNCSKENHLIGHNNDDQSASINKSKKNTIGLFCTGFGRGSSPVNAGHWVKTDSDYLVLEL